MAGRVGASDSKWAIGSQVCERERLTESNFYAWRRTIAERDEAVIPKQQAAFLPMVLADGPQRSAAITIELHEGLLRRRPSGRLNACSA